MITAKQLAESFGVEESAAAAALAEVDQQAAFQARRQRITIRLWDKTSPINDFWTVDRMMARNDVNPDAPVYLMDYDGQLIIQPHWPLCNGLLWMTDTSVMGIAEAHADHLAWEDTDGETLSTVMTALGIQPRFIV